LPATATGTEAAAKAALPPTGVASTSQILVIHLANHAPGALDEYGPDMADYAAELLWLSYRGGAKARAAEAGGAEAAALRPDRPSPDLAAALSVRPKLRAAIAAP
jgi:hypothetical protein